MMRRFYLALAIFCCIAGYAEAQRLDVDSVVFRDGANSTTVDYNFLSDLVTSASQPGGVTAADLDTSITEHTAIANAHQDLVTLAGVPDYLTLVGQQITRDYVHLDNDTTGTLLTDKISSAITRDTEWDTVGEIETATGYDFGNAGNLDTGTVADARIPSTIARDTELPSVISDLSDVSAITPSNNYVLKWNSTLGEWFPNIDATDDSVSGAELSSAFPAGPYPGIMRRTGSATFDLISSVAVSQGGTGATDAAGARGNLGLGSTDNVSFGSIRPSGGVLGLDLQSATDRVAVYADDGSTVALIDNSGNTTLEGNLDTTGGATITGNATVGDVFIRSLPSADFSVAIGDSTTGDAGGKYIVAIGPNAGSAYIGTESGVFIGQDAGRSATGHDNYFAGRFAGYSTTTGERNLGLGRTALTNIAGASSFNTSVGNYSGRFYGAGAGGENQYDGNLTTANDGVFLGNWARPGVNSSTNEIAIGYDAVGNGSNTATIGNDNITTTVLKGVVVSTTSTLGTMAQLTPRADPPSSPSTGMVYCDSDDGKLYAYDGSTWNALW